MSDEGMEEGEWEIDCFQDEGGVGGQQEKQVEAKVRAVVVGEPSAVGSIGRHIRYRIKVYFHSGQEEIVHRRYSEFAWLYMQLCHQHPCSLVPAFPPKMHVPATADLFDRMSRLQLFLSRTVEHQLLQRSPSLALFLRVDG
jgi:hypothetical protein